MGAGCVHPVPGGLAQSSSQARRHQPTLGGEDQLVQVGISFPFLQTSEVEGGSHFDKSPVFSYGLGV